VELSIATPNPVGDDLASLRDLRSILRSAQNMVKVSQAPVHWTEQPNQVARIAARFHAKCTTVLACSYGVEMRGALALGKTNVRITAQRSDGSPDSAVYITSALTTVRIYE